MVVEIYWSELEDEFLLLSRIFVLRTSLLPHILQQQKKSDSEFMAVQYLNTLYGNPPFPGALFSSGFLLE